MRKALVKYNNVSAGILSEEENGEYQFVYYEGYVKNYGNKFITFQMPVTYQPYRSKRLFPFFDGLIPEGWLLNIAFFNQEKAPILPYNFSEMEKLAKKAVLQSVTVPGVQPKLSLGWIKAEIQDGRQGRLTILDALDGHYILKPQNRSYPQMPENEHLSMKLAELFDIIVVPSNMIRLKSG